MAVGSGVAAQSTNTSAAPAGQPAMSYLYRLEGESFVPTALAASPWGAGLQHGGPPSALLARSVEHTLVGSGLIPVRWTLDLFRPVPLGPVSVQVQTLRRGRRIAVLSATLLADDRAVTHATALALLPPDHPELPPAMDPPAGPESLELGRLMPEPIRASVPPGFHTHVEIKWATSRDSPSPAIWFRMPMFLVSGEDLTPFQRAAAISDFGNAVTTIALVNRGEIDGRRHVNTDISLYMIRLPKDEWLCLRFEQAQSAAGLGITEVSIHDALGRFGHISQARLRNDP